MYLVCAVTFPLVNLARSVRFSPSSRSFFPRTRFEFVPRSVLVLSASVKFEQVSIYCSCLGAPSFGSVLSQARSSVRSCLMRTVSAILFLIFWHWISVPVHAPANGFDFWPACPAPISARFGSAFSVPGSRFQ
jgi:hypothetical protein